MASSGRRIVRQTNHFKDIALDFAQRSLIINFSTEAVLADEAGDIAGSDISAQRKRVRLKVMNEETDIPALAEAIMASCDVIPRAKLRLVIELLYELQQEDLNAMRGRPGQPARAVAEEAAAAAPEEAEEEDDEDMRGANMDDVDDYLERLYEEDVAEKVAGARRILGLAVQVSVGSARSSRSASSDRSRARAVVPRPLVLAAAPAAR